MSRTLSKVLVICALAIVLPLMIVGTAFAAFVANENILNVSVVFVDDIKAMSDDVHARIKYNGSVGENFEVKEGSTKTVVVSTDYSNEAYKFLGWFQGDKVAYNNAVQSGEISWASKDEVLSIKMDNSANYVAVYEVVKYAVTWDYKVNPSDEATTEDAPNGAKETYVYGDVLPTLSTEEEEYIFDSWKVAGDEINTGYTTATFVVDSETAVDAAGAYKVQLSDPWRLANKISVKFYKSFGDTNFVEKVLYETNSWSIPNADNEMFTSLGLDVNVGYDYTWTEKDAAGNDLGTITTIGVSENSVDLQLYLNVKVHEYTNVQLLDPENAINGAAKKITFSVENYAAFDKWFNLPLNYEFWEIEGIKLGDKVYKNTDADKKELAQAYAANPQALELAITKHLTSINFNLTESKILFNAKANESSSTPSYSLPVVDKKTWEAYENTGLNAYEVSCNGQKESSQTVYDLLGIAADDEFVAFVSGGNADEAFAVEFIGLSMNVTVKVGGKQQSKNLNVMLTGNETLNDLISQFINGFQFEDGFNWSTATIEISGSIKAIFDRV